MLSKAKYGVGEIVNAFSMDGTLYCSATMIVKNRYVVDEITYMRSLNKYRLYTGWFYTVDMAEEGIEFGEEEIKRMPPPVNNNIAEKQEPLDA